MRTLFRFFFWTILLAAGMYALSGFLLNRFSRSLLPELEKEGERLGVGVRELRFKDAGPGGLDQVVWTSPSMMLELPAGASGAPEGELSLSASEISLRVENLKEQIFRLNAKGLGIILFPPGPVKAGAEREQIARLEGDFSYRFYFPFRGPESFEERVRGVFRPLARLLKEGRAEMQAEFSGVSRFFIEGKPFQARLHMERQGTESVLRMDMEDLRGISRNLSEELTEEEMKLISHYPVRVPRLLEIKRYSEARASAARKERGLTYEAEDAYKHVLWSYLLTRAYGAEFARKVADAHEIGDEDNSEADHIMDFRNNEAGRRYALEGFHESSLLKRALTDPSVVRTRDGLA